MSEYRNRVIIVIKSLGCLCFMTLEEVMRLGQETLWFPQAHDREGSRGLAGDGGLSG